MPKVLEKRIKNRVTNLRSRSKKNGTELPLRDEIYYLVRDSFKKGFNCYYCGIPLKIYGDCYERFSIDHKIPISRGGGNNFDNLCVCCVRCNEVKGCMTEQEFFNLLGERKGDELHEFLILMHMKMRKNKCTY